MLAGISQLTKIKAIEWARKDCKADIVSMSFGFDEELYTDNRPVISNSIHKAL